MKSAPISQGGAQQLPDVYSIAGQAPPIPRMT
jgi:hypothetical protein